MHDMLKKGSWCMRSIEQSLASSTLRCTHAVFLASLSSFAYLASGCSAALRSWVRWRSVASLVCLAAGCSAALRTCRLSSLACLTSVCSDLLCSWSLWRRRCSLAVALSYRSRRNLSRTQCVARGQNRICSFNLNIRYMVGRTGHTHASRNAVTLVWGSLRLAPNIIRNSYSIYNHLKI